MMDEDKEANIVAFVGQDHLINVVKQIVDFLNKGESFLTYKRPPSMIDDPTLL